MNENLKTNQAGLNLISDFEGLVLHVYDDSVGVATIGYGTTIYPDGTPVKFGDPDITKEQALEYLAYGIAKFEKCVRNNVLVELNENQFSALVSFAYNVGCGGLQHSTLLRKINNSNFEVEYNFLSWNHAGGRVLDGLTRRRQAEWELFNTPVEVAVPTEQPAESESTHDVADSVLPDKATEIEGDADGSNSQA